MFDITTQGKHGLHRLGDQRLQRHVLSSGMRRPAIAMTTLVCPAATTPTFLARDEAPAGLDAGHPVALAADAGDLAVLDDVDARAHRRARA